MTDQNPLTGFVIHVTHEDDFDRVQPIVRKHLAEMMSALLDAGIVDPAVDCGPYYKSSAGTFSQED